MKKIALYVIGIMMSFSLVSCSSSDSETNTQNVEATASDSAEDTASNTENEQESDEAQAEEKAELSETGLGWQVTTIVDDFGDPVETTDEKSINYTFSGDFSNSATNSSPLTGTVYIDELQNEQKPKLILFDLNEYGDVPASFTSGDEMSIKYKIDDAVFEYKLNGTAPTSKLGMEVVPSGTLSPDNTEYLFQQLCRGKDVKCIISIGHSRYNFTIGGEGIVKACTDAGITPFEVIDISSIEGCLQALKAKQQLDEVEQFLTDNHSNYDRLSNDEIVSVFTNSKWNMYGKLGGEGEDAEFSEDSISGTFLESALKSHDTWSAENELLEAYGLKYEVYRATDSIYLLYVDSTHTSIIAEKTE